MRRVRAALAGLLLAALPAGGAGAARMFTLSLEDVADGRAEIVDLSHVQQPGVPLFPGGIPFTLLPVTALADGYYMNSFSAGEHTGTHLDAPAHFGAGRPTVDEIPAARLVSRGILVDVRHRAAADPNYVLTVADLQAWEKENGRIPPRSLVILNTGWHLRWEHPDRYLNRDDKGVLRFPGFSLQAITHLMRERDVNGLGTDTASIDPGALATFDGHKALLGGGRYALENLDKLDLLPAKGFGVIVAPLKIGRGSGAPARVLAIVPR